MSDARVLVVDDVPANVRLLEAVLAPRGYEVSPATEALWRNNWSRFKAGA